MGELAVELEIQPSLIHQWTAAVFAQADRAFEDKRGRQAKDPATKRADAKEQQIKKLEEKLHRKNEVISELMEENIKAKKDNGDL